MPAVDRRAAVASGRSAGIFRECREAEQRGQSEIAGGRATRLFREERVALQAFAHTENPLRMVFELDDQFDSYSDAGTMTSLQYEMHLNERGQKVDSVQRMTATGKEPAPANATETRVLPGTRDPLGMMQYLRNVDWTKTAEVRSPVYDGHKLYDVQGEARQRGRGSHRARGEL